jgi:Family of unknown function (DUF5309)
MAVVTRYDYSNSIREDLEDIIYNISPTRTPFMNNVGRTSCDNTYHEWQTDILAAADGSNAAIEGADAATSTTNFVAPNRVGNYTQISTKTLLVSGTSGAVDAAGMKTIEAYLIAKHGKELKRDMEKILLSNQGSTAGNSSSTARTLAGFPAWIRTTAQTPAGNGVGVGTVTGPVFSGGASSYAGTPTSGWTLTSGAANFTEANLKSAIAALYSNGGEPKMMMVGPVNKARVSGFSGLSATRINTNLHAGTTSGNTGNQGTIVGAADLYLSDFGDLSIVPNLFCNETFAYLVDPDYAKVAYLRPFQRNELARTGDAKKSQLVAEYTLVINSPYAHGVVANISTT